MNSCSQRYAQKERDIEIEIERERERELSETHTKLLRFGFRGAYLNADST